MEQDKPRKLEDETALYLSEIDAQLTAIPPEDEEGISLLVENVLGEISNRSASAACDRRTNYLIEKLVGSASFPLLLDLLQRWTPYVIFLSRNRFASHIVQTAISRICWNFENNSSELKEINYESIILNFLTPLLNEFLWLIKEMSATHVVRNAFCLLSGFPCLEEKKKGKNSKHLHSVKDSVDIEELYEKNKRYIRSEKRFEVPDSFTELLSNSFEKLKNTSTRELQLLLTSASSVPVLTLILRFTSNPQHQHKKLIEQVFFKSINCKDFNDENFNSNVFYEISCNKTASYYLETTLECLSLDIFEELIEKCLLTYLMDYALENCANFVLQAILKRLVGDFFALKENASKNEKEEKKLIKISNNILSELVSKKNVYKLLVNRGGVISWLLELSNALSYFDKKSTYAYELSTLVLSYWENQATRNKKADNTEENNNENNEEDDDEVKQEKDIINESVAEYLSFKFTSELNKEKDTKSTTPAHFSDSQQLLVSRILGSLLQLTLKNEKNKEILTKVAQIISKLSLDALKIISQSGPMGKAILNTFLDLYSKSINESNKSQGFSILAEFKALNYNLTMIGFELASHYVGNKIIKSFYDLSDLRGKEKWVTTICGTPLNNNTTKKGEDEKKIYPSLSLLAKSKEGRNSINIVQAELYAKNPTEWRNLIKKQLKAKELLSDLISSGPAEDEEKDSKKRSKDDDEEDDEEDGEAEGKNKRKRKRKRSNKNE